MAFFCWLACLLACLLASFVWTVDDGPGRASNFLTFSPWPWLWSAVRPHSLSLFLSVCLFSLLWLVVGRRSRLGCFSLSAALLGGLILTDRLMHARRKREKVKKRKPCWLSMCLSLAISQDSSEVWLTGRYELRRAR